MRKPRDYDAELKTLDDKARLLRQRKVAQIGELVIACGADTLTTEQLAGALLATIEGDAAAKEGWRKRGTAFFQRTSRRDAKRADRDAGRAPARDGSAASA